MVTVWWRGDRIPAGVGKDPIFFSKGGPFESETFCLLLI